MKKALMTASVASMIDQFNMDNIKVLQDMGYEVHVACNFIEGNTTSTERIKEFIRILKELNIKAYNIPLSRNIFKLNKNIYSYILLKKLSTKHKYDIVHCHSPIGGAITRLAFKNSRKNGTKVIYTAHGFHFFKGAPLKNWLIYYPSEYFLAKHTDVLITINKEDYRMAKKFNAKEIIYIPGVGVDSDKFHKNILSELEKQQKREKLHISKGEIVFLSVGELSKNKNHELAIRAFARCDLKDFKYFICGIGPLEKKLDMLIKELSLDKQIKLLGYRSDINELCNIADSFIFTSVREGLPVAVMEAMASGLPVICTNIRGNNDLVKHNLGGYMVELNNVDLFAEAIKSIYYNINKRKSMSEYNYRYIYKFSKNNVNVKMKNIYLKKDI